MADSRSLLDDEVDEVDDDDYHRLAFMINTHYAKLHGYSIRFVHTPCLMNDVNTTTITSNSSNAASSSKDCIACHHIKYGPRFSPWCKVLAIQETIQQLLEEKEQPQQQQQQQKRYNRIVYLDSDAFVNQIDQPLPDKYFLNTLTMLANPKEVVPCSGIQFWNLTTTTTTTTTGGGRDNNNTATATATAAQILLQTWWNSNPNHGYYNTHHDYEQSVFHRHFNNTKKESPLLRNYKNHIDVKIEPVREYSRTLPSKSFFRHITNKGMGIRYERMLQFMNHHNISTTTSLKDYNDQDQEDGVVLQVATLQRTTS